MSSRLVANGLFTGAIIVALLVFAQMIFTPDAGASYFARAQQLETAGNIPLALQHYRLLSENHPESVFAPRALLREGDLLAAQGRQKGEVGPLRQAVAAYAKLAKDYSSDPLANEALFDAGQISSDNLHDIKAARGYYNQLIESNSPNSDVAATATLKLGRLALNEGDGKTARTLLQRVLQRWPRNAMAGAEAQFHLGVVFETLLKNQSAAQNAYSITLKRYPNSTWASNARERLGLLAYTFLQGRTPARRVMLDVESLPDDNGLSDNNPKSPWNALRPLLAARGMAVSDLTMQGWSLTPFWAALDTRNPARAVTPSFDSFENVVANAGLRFTVKGGGREDEALRDLQDDIDAGRLPLVYFTEKGQGRWTLCVGYDTERNEVMLQDRGARFDTLAVKSFAAGWKSSSSFGKSYTLLSFVAVNSKQNVKPNLTPTPLPSPVPGKTPMPLLDAPPAFLVDLPTLNRAEAHRRTLRRAAIVLQRNGNGQVLLGATALDWLAKALDQVMEDSRESDLKETPPVEDEPGDEELVSPTPAPNGEGDALEQPSPTPEATEAPKADTADIANRARRLLGFFGAPARQWIALRRQAGAYCDLAARQTDDSKLSQAAQNLNLSATSLEEASRLVPNIGDTMKPGDREALESIVRQLRRAREAERQAARSMQ